MKNTGVLSVLQELCQSTVQRAFSFAVDELAEICVCVCVCALVCVAFLVSQRTDVYCLKPAYQYSSLCMYGWVQKLHVHVDDTTVVLTVQSKHINKMENYCAKLCVDLQEYSRFSQDIVSGNVTCECQNSCTVVR